MLDTWMGDLLGTSFSRMRMKTVGRSVVRIIHTALRVLCTALFQELLVEDLYIYMQIRILANFGKMLNSLINQNHFLHQSLMVFMRIRPFHLFLPQSLITS